MAATRKRELRIPRHVATELGRSAVDAAERGHYVSEGGKKVGWSRQVQAARAAKLVFDGAFSDVLFAVADWSPDRRTLGPFRDVFDSRRGRYS